MVSLQHWAAASLKFKAAGIAQLTETVVHDPAVSALRRKVSLHSGAAIGREAACARVVLRDGRVLEANVLRCRGSAGRPLTDEDLSEKTRGQLLTVFSNDASERILDECWRIEKSPRVDALCGLLAEAG